MSQTQAEFKRRRKAFQQTYCYDSDDVLSKAQLYQSYKRSLHSTNNQRIHLLPTVRDRIDSLWKALSVSHPCYSMVLQLAKSIKQNDQDQDQDQNHTTAMTATALDFPSLFALHKNNTTPHKLHTLILARTIQSDPVHYAGGYTGTPSFNSSSSSNNNNNNALSVRLDRFVGDVLIAFYLLGHTSSRIIESGPNCLSDHQWQSLLMEQLGFPKVCMLSHANRTFTAKQVPPVVCYRIWVYLHSLLLRAAPFSWGQQNDLGTAAPASSSSISSSSSEQAFLDVAQGSLLRPHQPFVPPLDQLLPFLWRLQSITNFESIRVSFSTFGPLGPAFRGRDNIHSQILPPASLLGVLTAFCAMPPEEYVRGPVGRFTPFLQSWASGDDAIIQILLQIHTESRKARPMTVAPPLLHVQGCS